VHLPGLLQTLAQCRAQGEVVLDDQQLHHSASAGAGSVGAGRGTAFASESRIAPGFYTMAVARKAVKHPGAQRTAAES
jgi:hypothetical protein